MGIYINKVLGYGIQMTSEEASSMLNKDAVRHLHNMTGEEYLGFLEVKYGKADPDNHNYYLNDLHSSDLSEMPKHRATDFVTVHDTAEESQNSDFVWVVITPPLVCKEWRHHDDAIDYYEESYKSQDSPSLQLDHNIKFFKHGLFPYEGSFINHATGETPRYEHVRLLGHYIRATADGSTPEEDRVLNRLLETLKISSVEEFEEVIHPAPPVSVVDIAEWTGIFNDVSVASRLRPALLTFWR